MMSFSKFKIVLFFFSSVLLGQQNVRINEILTSNVGGLIDVKSGEYSDWIEFYNPADSTVDLSGYYLTDNIEDSLFWQFPNNTLLNANSYLIVFADDKNNGLHTNFKLNSDGEQIILLSPELKILDSLTYSNQKTDVSYGRDPNNVSQWLYYPYPTPGNTNTTYGVVISDVTDQPEISNKSGFYTNEFMLNINAVAGNTRIFYSTDGSYPELGKNEFIVPILIDSTTIVKIIAVEEGKLPSKFQTRSYFINENSNLSTISIITDPKNLWDDETGIYTVGTNGISFWGVKANYWQDWERPINIEFFEEDHSKAFEVNAGIAINGARRNMLQKSFRISARKKYGDEVINYKIFPEKEIRQFNALVLRNGGYPEFRYTLFRDGFLQKLISNSMALDYQAYRPSILFVNGKYWGIYNIREKQNEEYLYKNNGVDPNNLDVLENNMEVIEGDSIQYQNMIDFITVNDLSVTENYDSVGKWMDIDNYINYQIAELYIANLDWPANNIKYWRPRTKDGKWKWMLFDIDGGFGIWANYDFNTIEYATAENSPDKNNAPWSTFLFRKLLKNQTFADEFVQRFAAHISYSFNPIKVTELVDQFQIRIENDVSRHLDRWSKDCSPTDPETKDGCIYSDIDTWYAEVDIIRDFALNRPYYMRKYLMEYFGISDTLSLKININDSKLGKVLVNNVQVEEDLTAQVFANKNLLIEARPNQGYEFVRWEGSINSTNPILALVPTTDLNLEAIFEELNYNIIPSKINEDIELINNGKPYIAQSDIYISENSKLSVQPGIEIRIPENSSIYVFGSIEFKGTKENKISIRPISTDKRWGAINLINAKKKSFFNHVKITGTSHGKDELTQFGGISSFNSNLELNYVTMDSVLFPIYIEYGKLEMRNSVIHTNVTSDLVNVKYGKAVIENCEFIGDNAIDTDGIDLDGVKYGIVRRNKIHEFLGDNCDGIDIGEGAKDVLIEDNFIYNCSDKGISVGQESTALIKGNTIFNCNLGVGIKDSLSYGIIDHNTFYNNYIAVSCFEKIAGRGGGKADITNTIFSNSSNIDVFADEFSEINVNYSLSDKFPLSGEGNLLGDPGFFNPDAMDFRVTQNSITIDAGDPNYEFDADGTRTNIGASFSDFNLDKKIVINEINYHSNAQFDTKDWVELYNYGPSDVDVSKWIFKDSDDLHSFEFPINSKIISNSFLIICEDTLQFKSLNPNVESYIGNYGFGLNNSGEQIRLFDNAGNIMDSLTYNDKLPWPLAADGEGYTLQLINYERDNSKPENWSASVLYGTPGSLNIIVDQNDIVEKVPTTFSLSQNYPNPFNPTTTIKYQIPVQDLNDDLSVISRSNATWQSDVKTGYIVSVQLKVYDILGREVAILVNQKQKPGFYEVLWNATKHPSGVYFYRLQSGNSQVVRKMILLK